MMLKRNRVGLTLFALLTISTPAIAQNAQNAQVSGTVRNNRGEIVTNARLRATAGALDTTVTTNVRGEYRFRLPMGRAFFAVTAFGYEPLRVEVAIDKENTRADFQIKGLARQIAEFAVRDRWTGIRGVVGDDSTRQPLAGVEVMIPQARATVKTDSLGRFEIPLPVREEAVLRVTHDGYVTRLVSFAITENQATDVMVLLKPGEDVKGNHIIMRDLEIRMKLKPLRNFVMGSELLTRGGGKSIYDAIVQSGMLPKNGLMFGDKVCILVDGQPRSGFTIETMSVENVEFIEVYGFKAELTNSMRTAMHGAACTEKFTKGPKLDKHGDRRVIEYIAVWTKK